MDASGGSVANLFQQGMDDFRAGRLPEVEAACRQILAAEPAHADALHLLGAVAHQIGRNDLAIDHFRRAIELDGGRPSFHNNLGIALRDLGRFAEAESSCREALRLRPEFAAASYNLGYVLNELGRWPEAEASLRRALDLRPDFADAHNSLGFALHKLDHPAEAVASYREALRLRPGSPEAHSNLGAALRDLGHLEEAESSCREALRLRPEFTAARYNLGYILNDLGRWAEAEANLRAVLRVEPNLADAHNNLGIALYALGRTAEAEASYREALRLRPDFPEVRNNLGYALLSAGRFEEGWHEHEWRWKTKNLSAAARDFPVPLWNGEAVGDRVILLHAEQGLGDTLQFCRYVPLVAAGARTVLEVQAPLVRLLSGLPGVTEIVARGESLPPFDLHCPLLSLPCALGTTLDSIPARIPYLAADPARAADWRARLAGLDSLKVGLVWAGGRRLEWPELIAIDRRRSIALDALAPLGEVSGVSVVSLQKGEPAGQTASPPRGMVLHDFTADLRDFADTAALVDGLDLVISVDTAVVHLAGALGKPVWLLNRFDSCWRWLRDRDDSPWYPLLRQFRQPSPGDWNSVIHAARNALQLLAAGDRDQLRPS